ncbi:MAG: phosphonopyruvate decarboxylase [Alphaproteobacteria bacterium]
MIEADGFLAPARARGIDFFTGVPCSFLTPIINRVISDHALHYVGAANEGEAVAIAAGAWLAGRGTAVMCQNSGLGNMVNPLTSLNFAFRIPTLLIVTWRAQPGLKDEPQHELMGQITPDLLELMRIPHLLFPTEADQVVPVLSEARRMMDRTDLPVALIMQKDSVRDDGLDEPELPRRPRGTLTDLTTGGARVRRVEALEAFLAHNSAAHPVIATTGKSGRELFTLDDRENHLYQVGSMGCASAMGLGLALNTEKPVFVLDGDGALLMHMGVMSTIGARHPGKFIHIVLDNGVHDSTGGQRTDSAHVDFAAIALAAGYDCSFVTDDIGGFEAALRQAATAGGPALVHMRIAPGSISGLGRPTITPPEVARRFRDCIARA